MYGGGLINKVFLCNAYLNWNQGLPWHEEKTDKNTKGN